jgi:hypothetical protein
MAVSVPADGEDILKCWVIDKNLLTGRPFIIGYPVNIAYCALLAANGNGKAAMCLPS